MATLSSFRSIFIFLLVGLALAYGYQTKLNSHYFLYSDFGKFHQSARFFWDQKNIYGPIYVIKKDTSIIKKAAPDLNPPFFTLLILPLGLLSYKTALWIWFSLSITAGLISIFLIQKTIRVRAPPMDVFIALSTAFFIYFPTFANTQFEQITLILLPFVAGAWLAEKKELPILAGFLLGFAASLKIFLGLFLFYFLMRRAWRACAAFVISGFILTVLPLYFFGTDTYFNYYSNFHDINWYASSWNASLLGLSLRLLGGNENNIALFPFHHLAYLLYDISAILLAAGLLIFLTPNNKIDFEKKRDLDFSVVVVSILLLSPLGWLYYFPLLCIPFLVLIQTTETHQHPLKFRLFIMLALALSGIPHLFTSSGHIIDSNALSIFLISSAYVATLFILLGILFLLRFGNKKLGGTPSHFHWIYALALLPSLFGILHTINMGVLFGERYVIQFNAVYFDGK